MLKLRFISAGIGVPLIILLVWAGGYFMVAFVALIISLATYEYHKMVQNKALDVPFALLLFCTLLPLAFAVFLPNYGNVWLWFCLFLLGLWIIIRQKDFLVLSVSFFAILYIGWSLSTAVLMRNLEQGGIILFYTLVIIWLTDTGGYFVGRAFGKHKISPVSPKKSWEGAVGGLIVAVAVLFLFNCFFKTIPWYHCLIMGVGGSVVGQLGDFVESALKRWSNIKDSGNTIPGHGGMLDRLDSIILGMPFIYFYYLLLIK